MGAVNVATNVPSPAVVPEAGLNEPPPLEVRLTAAQGIGSCVLRFATRRVIVELPPERTVVWLATRAVVSVVTGAMLVFSIILVELFWTNVTTLSCRSCHVELRAFVELICVVSPATRFTGWLR